MDMRGLAGGTHSQLVSTPFGHPEASFDLEYS